MRTVVASIASVLLLPIVWILLNDEIQKRPLLALGAALLVILCAIPFTLWQIRRAEQLRAKVGVEEVPGETKTRFAARTLAAAVEFQWRPEASRRGLLAHGARADGPIRALMPISWSLDREPKGLDSVAQRKLRAWDGKAPSVDRLADLFREMPSEFMVVLGSPESGKTAAAVLLTLGLLGSRAETGDAGPVPVLFNLASWDPKLDLRSWLKQRLVDDHPWLRAEDLYGEDAPGKLIAEHHVLPILDGLDEVKVGAHELEETDSEAKNRADVIEEIATSGLPALALTCRREEYRAAELKGGAWLGGAVVVKLEEATPQQALDYLRSVIPDYPELLARWEPVFADLTGNPSGPLASALSSPLMVTLAHEVYRDARRSQSPGDLLRIDEREEIEAYLLDAFVPAVFPAKPPRDNRGRSWRRDDARQWLAHIAAVMEAKGETQLRWWDLSAYARPATSILAGVLATGTAMLAVGLAFTVLFGPLVGILVGGLVAAAIGALCARNGPPVPSEIQVQLSGRLQSALISGLSISLIVGVIGSVVRDPGFGILVGLGFGIPIGILYGLTGPVDIARVVDPRMLLRRDVYVGLTYGVAYGVPAGIVGWLLADDVVTGVVLSVACALAGGLLYGPIWMLAGQGSKVGVVAFAHLALAILWLAPQGKLPWRVMDFLDHAHHVGVLRQAGGVYEFRHRRLQQTLANPATGLPSTRPSVTTTGAEAREDGPTGRPV